MRLHVRIFILLLLANVLTRFFTNYLGVLPRHFNIADVALTLLLWGLSLLHTSSQPRHPLHRLAAWVLPAVNGIALLAYLFNDHPGHLPAAASQMLMLSEPLLLLLAISRLGLTEVEVSRYLKWFEVLVKIEFIIGLFQLQFFIATGDSESLMGTFQHNAEHYAAFLTLGIFFLFGKFRVHNKGGGFRVIMMLGMLLLVLVIDNKASWLGLAVSILAVLLTFGALGGRVTGTITALAGGFLILGMGLVLVLNVSGSLYKFDRLTEIWRNGEIARLGKIKALRDIVTSNKKHPHMWLIGSGPGSFYSRAARQYFGASRNKLYADQNRISAESDDYAASNSMGGVINRADKEPYFSDIQQVNDTIVHVGTGQIDEPFSFYNGLIGELGLLGCFLYLFPYWKLHGVLKEILKNNPRDCQVVPLTTATYGLLIYMLVNSVYGPMLETGRMTTILWSLAACCLVFNRRHATGEYEHGLTVGTDLSGDLGMRQQLPPARNDFGRQEPVST